MSDKLQAAKFLALGSRGTAQDFADVIRGWHAGNAEVVDRLAENFDRIAALINEHLKDKPESP